MKLYNIENAVQAANDARLKEFEAFLTEHKDIVYNIAFRMMGNARDAECIALETFVTAYKRIGNYRDKEGCKILICGIAVNACIKALKKNRRLGYNATSDEENVLLRIMDALSPGHKAMIILKDVAGFSYEDTTKILNCSMRTLKLSLPHARRNLMRMLAEADGYCQGCYAKSS